MTACDLLLLVRNLMSYWCPTFPLINLTGSSSLQKGKLSWCFVSFVMYITWHSFQSWLFCCSLSFMTFYPVVFHFSLHTIIRIPVGFCLPLVERCSPSLSQTCTFTSFYSHIDKSQLSSCISHGMNKPCMRCEPLTLTRMVNWWQCALQ